jgi:hypothetical protein
MAFLTQTFARNWFLIKKNLKIVKILIILMAQARAIYTKHEFHVALCRATTTGFF